VSEQDQSEFRFDGKVAIVTGAGNNPSLGRAYCRLFAERGASVVVNDLGVGSDGRNRVRANAVAVAEEICGEGGIAVADTNSVAEKESAEAVVQTALDAFGRVDILVNNANVINHAPFDVLSDADVQRQVDVHLMGTIWMNRAVWPHMKKNGYGRIVNIASGAMWGHSHTSIYGAAKAGAFGLARNLAVEGQPHGIKVNTVSPQGGGVSVKVFNDEESDFYKEMMEYYRPELVAPTVALLSHEQCPCNGKIFFVSGGRVHEIFIGRTQGYFNRSMTIEDVLENWDEVTDRTDPKWFQDAEEYEVPQFVTIPYEPS
jgi:NAD(P)-dependent dehydrogenase (short-subunit alcohol dehydrogenase family)